MTGIKFQHDFPTFEGVQYIDSSELEENVAKVKTKYIYMKTKTENFIRNSESICLIREEQKISKVSDFNLKGILEYFKKLNPQVRLCIVVSDRNFIGDHEFVRINDEITHHKINKPINGWKGNYNHWKNVFESLLKIYDSLIRD